MNQYVLITGASGGIGKAFAYAFAKKNKNLILVARSKTKLDDIALDIRDLYSVDVIVIIQDLSNNDSAEELFEATKQYSIGILVNNAGFGVTGEFAKNDIHELEKMLLINNLTLTKLIYLYLPELKKQKGKIINVASNAAFQPVPFMAAYAATKAYVLHLSEALHEELISEKVEVMALCPSATDTNFWKVAKMDPKTTKLKLYSPDFVVNWALKALDKRRSYTIPGFVNNLTSFFIRFTPRSLVTKIARKLVGH